MNLKKSARKNTEQLSSKAFGTVDVVVNEIIKTNDEKRAKHPPKPAKPIVTISALTVIETTQVTPIVPPNVITEKPAEKLVPISRVREIIAALLDTSTADTVVALIEEELL